MKYIVFIVFWSFLLTSCMMTDKIGRIPVETPPFIKFSSGKILKVKEVGMTVGFGSSNELYGDGIPYDQDTITYFSNGSTTFANVGNGNFLPKFAEGKINVYKYDMWISKNMYFSQIDPPTGYGGDFHEKRTFIQDSASEEVHLLNYKSLKIMIPQSSPAWKVLENFKVTRTTSLLCILGGFGAFIAGSVIAGNAINKNQNSSVTNTGVTMIFGGMGVISVGSIFLGINRLKKNRVVGIYNGVIRPN
jgi:hypothetical protein